MSDKTEKIELEDLTKAQEIVLQVVMEEGAMRNQDETLVLVQSEIDAIIDLGGASEEYIKGMEHILLLLKNQWGVSIEL
jgi:hypothetical protein